MSWLRFDNPKFGTFDEKALRDGALRDGVEKIVQGESIPAAILDSIKGASPMTTDTSPSAGLDTVQVANKSIFSSKTFWANFLGGISAPWLAYLAGTVPIQVPLATTIGSILNIGLRFISVAPVTVAGVGTTTVQNNVK